MRFHLIVGILAMLICGSGVHAETASPAGAANAAVAPARIVLLVDEVKQIRNFPVVVAESLGYFKGDDFVVTVMNIRDEVPTSQMLMDGRVDAVMAYYHHTIVNRSEGRNFEAIVNLGIAPGVKVMVANQAKDKYKTVADLKGSRIIAGGAGSSKTTVANYLMVAGGLQIGDYTRISNHEYDKDKIVDALKMGAADLVIAPTPDGDYYEQKGVASVFADLTTAEGTKKALGVLFPQSTIYMTSARVAANPNIALRLATSMVRTLAWIKTHTPEQILEVIPEAVTGKDRASYLNVLKEQIPVFASDGRMPGDGAEKEYQILSLANPKYKSVKVGETYTNDFVDAALKPRAAN